MTHSRGLFRAPGRESRRVASRQVVEDFGLAAPYVSIIILSMKLRRNMIVVALRSSLAAGLVTWFGLADALVGQEPIRPVPNQPSTEPPRPGDRPQGGMPTEGDPAKPGEPPLPPAILLRPAEPPLPPRPEELRIRPDASGKVRFNFRGQPWPDVLSWLADISDQSLDWQELPGDFLNLSTQRGYTVEEARDLINRHLLARGFTILESGEILNVVNLKKLDPGMVPRIEPEELAKRHSHEFVRVSFPLEWLVAESAVEELKPMLSPYGRLTSLKATNRLEAIDAVVNLRSIYRVIGQEQSAEGHDRMVREFELTHAKASEVQQQLQKLIGVEERPSLAMAGREGGLNREQVESMMRQQAEMLARDKDGRMAAMMTRKSDVSLVVNTRRNTVLAFAPPDKMAVITQAVKMLDVPSTDAATLNGALQRVQVYRLASLEPTVLAKMLEETGGLEPTTRLQADDKNKALIVHGSLADQFVIRAMVDKLDGASRKFQVIPLRRLEADYVAGTIEFMMGATPEEPQQNSRRNYYDPYDPRRSQPQEKERDRFRVDADVENNRLLVWANEIELKEVTNLLMKLGEISERGEGGGTMRVLPLPDGVDSQKALERLRQVWPALAPNRLVVPDDRSSSPTVPPVAPSVEGAPRKSEPKSDDPSPRPAERTRSTEQSPPPSGPRTAATTRTVAIALADEVPVREVPAGEPPAPRAPAEPASSGESERAAPPTGTRAPTAENTAPAPVLVTPTPQGKLVLSSSDPRALDLLEEIVSQLTAGERREFQVFTLHHSQSYWVRLNLEKYFEEDDKKESPRSARNVYFLNDSQPTKTEPRHRLSKRRKLRFISDSDTNTILVVGADPSQLRTIEELIEIYDQPLASDSKAARITSIYRVRWSKPALIAETLKDVYRDLLSSNDKALANSPDQRNRQQTTYIFGEGGDSDEKRTQVSFKGKLSIGVDETSGSLILSADGETLMQNVMKMVESLDEAAKPAEAVQVLKVDGDSNPESIRRIIDAVFGDPTKQRPGGGGSSNPQSNPQRQRSGNRR